MAKRDGVFQRGDRAGYYISYVDAKGVRRKQRVQASTRKQATDLLAGIKTKVEREKVLGIREVSDISTADLLNRFQRHQKTHLKPTTYVRLEGILQTLKRELPAAVKDISKATVADLVARRAKTVKPGTVHKEITTLKHALRLAVEWDLIPSNPVEGAKLPKQTEGKTDYLSPAQLKAVLQAAPEWMKAPIALAAFTGMRRGELLALKWTDVDMAGRRAYLRETKNGSLRVLPLNELAMKVLAELPRSAPEVLPGINPALLTVTTVRVFRLLGIKGSFHSLRHTAASWLVMEGVDLYVVGQVLGHRTPRMTQRYAHLSPTYMANALAKLDNSFGDVFSGDAVGTKEAVQFTTENYDALQSTSEKHPMDIERNGLKLVKRAG